MVKGLEMKIIERKEAVSIGIIKGSEEQKKLWEVKKEVCRKYATPREEKVSGTELKNYLVNQHGAVEMEFPERQKQAFKAIVLRNIHPEASPEDIPDEMYGLQFSYLVIEDKDLRIYLELTTGRMQMSSTWYDTTELFREIVLWEGITKEDIENETSKFMVYTDEFYHSIHN